MAEIRLLWVDLAATDYAPQGAQHTIGQPAMRMPSLTIAAARWLASKELAHAQELVEESCRRKGGLVTRVAFVTNPRYGHVTTATVKHVPFV